MFKKIHFSSVCDIAIKSGKISAVGENLPDAKEEIDATECYVVPGLIDMHTHVYEHATELGVNPDEKCLARGNCKSMYKFIKQFHL